jgi:hypothetical protein
MSTEKQNGQDRTPRPDYIDGLDGINGRPVTKDERSYHDGYVEGQNKVKGTQYERERAAETNGLASGVIIGGVLAFAVGLGFAVWAYANRDLPATEQPSSINPVTAPLSPAPSVAPTAPSNPAPATTNQAPASPAPESSPSMAPDTMNPPAQGR